MNIEKGDLGQCHPGDATENEGTMKGPQPEQPWTLFQWRFAAPKCGEAS